MPRKQRFKPSRKPQPPPQPHEGTELERTSVPSEDPGRSGPAHRGDPMDARSTFGLISDQTESR